MTTTITQEVQLNAINEVIKDTAKDSVKNEDYAIAEYVRQVCEQLKGAGEDIKDYKLVRVSGFNVEYGLIQYSIEKSEQ